MIDNPQDEDLGLDENFDNFEKKKGTLGDLWRENVFFKIGVVVAAAVAIIGAIVLFGGSDEKTPGSLVPPGQEVSAPPGTEGASPAYVDAVKQKNEQMTETAQKEGTSAIPVPIEPPVGKLAIPEDATDEEDPLQRWRALQEERMKRELQKTQDIPAENQEADQNRQEAIQRLADLMSTQMQAILESKNELALGSKDITDKDWLKNLRKEEEEERKKAEEEAKAKAGENDDEDAQIIILPAGEIAYARLITEANSDAQGPVLAQIAGGPLNGSRIIGDFEVSERDKLIISFDTAVIKGISYDIDAIAVDPDTTLPALATDVDHHYLKKIILPAAASFITGFANAVSESGLTTIEIQNATSSTTTSSEPDDKQEIASGVAEAGQALEEILDDIKSKTQTTVIVASGTPIGVLFLEPVIESDENIKLKRDEPIQPVYYQVAPNAGLTFPGSYATLPPQSQQPAAGTSNGQ